MPQSRRSPSATGYAGHRVTMHAGYLLDPSGDVSTTMGTQHTNMSYSYVERGGGQETFRPFDYLGFRYLQIDDPGEALTTNDIVVLTRHDAVPDENAGTFTSSDKTLDAVFDLGRHSALFTMQEQFVDTPTREKGPWLGDGANESQTAMDAFGEHQSDQEGPARVRPVAGSLLAERRDQQDLSDGARSRRRSPRGPRTTPSGFGSTGSTPATGHC